MNNQIMKERWRDSVQGNYGQPTIALVHGNGLEVWDVEGKRYLDFLGGIATNVLGHAHPAIVQAVSKQIATLGHVSNFYSHPQVVSLAEKLQALTGDNLARTFFCNSGAEANEAALKLSRLTGKKEVISCVGAFHGRTMGALSLTGQPEKRKRFKPLLKQITHVPFGDIGAMKAAISKKTAMVIVEPILGEAGVVVPPLGYLKAIRELCDKHDVLFAIDAVQTGMGRTGEWFGFEHEGIRPDVITLAKGLGGGLPLGAMITLGGAKVNFAPGDHGSTFGGNPVALSAANAVIEVIEQEELVARAKVSGDAIKQTISELPGVAEVRGRGLLLGIVLAADIAKELQIALLKAGLLVNAATQNVIRIAPALIVTKEQISEFVEIFKVTLASVQLGSHG
ncbi:MAG: acetylornithine transaminase [Actinomycetes bacterium]